MIFAIGCQQSENIEDQLVREIEEILSNLVGVWELTAAIDADRTSPSFIIIDSEFRINVLKGSDAIYASLNNVFIDGSSEWLKISIIVENPISKGVENISIDLLGMSMPIDKVTNSSFVLVDDGVVLEYSRLVSQSHINRQDLYGTWIASSSDNEFLEAFFLEINDGNYAKVSNQRLSRLRTELNTEVFVEDIEWFLIGNFLILSSGFNYNDVFEIIEFSSDSISFYHIYRPDLIYNTMFTNQTQLLPEELIGEWLLENENNTPGGVILPTTLVFNTDGLGSWYDDVNTRNILWFTDDEHLFISYNSNLFLFNLVEYNDRRLILSIRDHLSSDYHATAEVIYNKN